MIVCLRRCYSLKLILLQTTCRSSNYLETQFLESKKIKIDKSLNHKKNIYFTVLLLIGFGSFAQTARV
jgi:hypothetical protein